MRGPIPKQHEYRSTNDLIFKMSDGTLRFCGLLSDSVGPLHSDRQYDIGASKEGFVLSPVEGTQGDFKAFALAGVTFMVRSGGHGESTTRSLVAASYNPPPPPLVCDADQVRGRRPPRRCPPVSKWSSVPLQPADPGYRSAHLQQPGRRPGNHSFCGRYYHFLS